MGEFSDIGRCPMLVCVVPVAHERFNLSFIRRGHEFKDEFFYYSLETERVRV